MAIILNKQQKQAYIDMFEEDYCINYLKSHINEVWTIEKVYDEDDTNHFPYLLTIGENDDDELTGYALELMGVRV